MEYSQEMARNKISKELNKHI